MPLFDPLAERSLLPQMVGLTLERLESQFGECLSRPRYAAFLLALGRCCDQRADTLYPGIAALGPHELDALAAGKTPAPPS